MVGGGNCVAFGCESVSEVTPAELLASARGGELDRLGEQRTAIAEAVRWFVDSGEGADALELVALTWRIWFTRGELAAGSALVRAALAAPSSASASSFRTRVLYAGGVLAFRMGDQERSRALNEEALELARASSDARGECDALTGLARVALRDSDFPRVIELARQARARARDAHDRAAEASPLHLEAAGVRLAGDYDGAHSLYMESLELNRALHDDAWVAMELHNLGWVELHLGDVDAAAARFRERDEGEGAEDAYGHAWRDLNWAAVAAKRGDLDEARRLLACGEAALSLLGVALDPDDQFELTWLRDQIGAARSQHRR